MSETSVKSAESLKILSSVFSWVGKLCCAAIAVFVIFTTIFGKFPAEAQYATVLTLGLVAVFLLKPGPLARNGAITVADAVLSLVLVAAAVGTGTYYLFNYYEIAAFREGIPNTADLTCYAVGTLVVTEAARRSEGWLLVGIVVAAFVYMAYGHVMPGVLGHRPMPISNALEVAYSYQGIFGIALGAVVDVVLAFVIVGAAIRISGAGDFFNFIALRATRRMRSGPAQGAIIGSALFGSVNGSAPANVSSTGVLTIPLMKRAGYSASFAGGMEATASCVGQIMPPIMGVGAFIMSEITGIPYAKIILVAIVPAFLFLLSLSVAAILEAQRLGIRANAEILADTWTPLRFAQAGVLVAGFGSLLGFLFSGYSPTFAGLSAAGVTLGVAMVLPRTRFGLQQAWTFLVDGGRDGLPVLIACAAIGVVIGAVTSTGLGIKLNQMIVDLGSGQLLPALLLAAVCSIMLGMGLPTAASYLMVVFVAGQSLIDLGISTLQTHFFVFYYAVLSAITPPVALAVFAAAAVAKAKPLKIAGNALRLCAVGFALPILWIYHPAIFFDNVTMATLPESMATLGSLILVIIAFNAAHIGTFCAPLSVIHRLLLLSGAAVAVYPNPLFQFAGSLLLVLLLGERFLAHRRTLALSRMGF